MMETGGTLGNYVMVETGRTIHTDATVVTDGDCSY